MRYSHLGCVPSMNNHANRYQFLSSHDILGRSVYYQETKGHKLWMEK